MKSITARSPFALRTRNARRNRVNRLRRRNRLQLEQLEDRRLLAADFVVNTTLDLEDAINDGIVDVDPSTPGNQLSLREAIKLANADANSTISFDLPGSRTLTVDSELPAITTATTIDASAQVGANPITLQTSVAGGGVNGLVVQTDGAVIHGLRIEGFGGDGIHTLTTSDLVLNEVIIRDNFGFGVQHRGDLHVNRGTDVPDFNAQSVFSGNGLSGILSTGFIQADRRVIVENNGGAGIASFANITIHNGVVASGNLGPGIQSIHSDILLTQGTQPDTTQVVIVTNNGGPGIISGVSALAHAEPGSSDGNEDSAFRGIRIQASAIIEGNAGWGVMAFGGDVTINSLPSQLRSSVSGNGSAAFSTISVLDFDGGLDTVENAVYEARGGIFATGTVDANFVDVRGNAGVGILGNTEVNLVNPTVEDNFGAGIQSAVGDVNIVVTNTVYESFIRRNDGPGIVAGAAGPGLLNVDLERLGSVPTGSIIINGPIFVTDNGGWGLLALNDISLGVFTADTRTSVIANNGDPSRAIFLYDRHDGGAFQESHILENGGGLAAGGSISGGTGLGAFRLFVANNHGAGIVVGQDIDLILPRVLDNQGAGVTSVNGTVQILGANVSGNSEIRISGNQGAGIQAAQDVVFNTGKVEIAGNRFGGVMAGRDVIRSETSAGGRLVVTENANPATGAGYTIEFDGEVRQLTFGELNQAGGVFASRDVSLVDAFITNNFGDGVVAQNDLFIERGALCFNTGEAAISNGEFELIDVNECEAIVINTRDSGFGSLRNALLIGGSIEFDVEALGVGPNVLHLLSELQINKPTSIFGPGTDAFIVDGGFNTRLISITEPDDDIFVEIQGLTLRNGNANGGEGGAIRNQEADLALVEVVISDSSAGQGGAIYSIGESDSGGGDGYGGDGYGGDAYGGDEYGGYGGGGSSSGSSRLTILESLLRDNEAIDGDGGAVWASSELVIDASMLQGNRASENGGGVYSIAQFQLDSSTLAENRARFGDGGGAWVGGRFNALNSTISGNRAAGEGGGINFDFSSDDAGLLHLTIIRNEADSGGGLAIKNSVSVAVTNTIIAQNTGGNLSGQLAFEDSNFIGGDPLLGELLDNGGFRFSFTHAPLPNSPILGAGSTTTSRDQRGFPRPVTAPRDIGAYQSNFDFGDAPSPYPVRRDDDGARHLVGTGLFFGNGVSSLADGQPSALANSGGTDVAFRAIAGGFSAFAIVNVSGPGLINAWIDFNVDGDWDDVGEQIFVNKTVQPGFNFLTFDVPPVMEITTTFARFRLSTQADLAPTGLAIDGEVDDIRLIIDTVLLPVPDSGAGFQFASPVTRRSRRTFDPDVATGYIYGLESGPNFATLELLPGFGNNIFTLGIDNGNGGFTDVFDFAAGDEIDFENDPRLDILGGVSRFRITGIELDAAVNPENPLAFPTVLSFVDDGIVTFTQTPITEFVNALPAGDADSGTTNEDTPFVVAAPGLLANDADTDPENLALTVTAVNGTSDAVGTTFTLASGATLLVNADGGYTYDPNGEFESLHAGQSTTDSFGYTVSDTHGGTADATVTITITGVNDAPVAVIVGAPQSSPEGAAIDLTATVSDPDVGTVHTLAWIVTKDGSAFASGSGATFRFTPDDNGTYIVNVTATDEANAVGSGAATIVVSNVAPTTELTGPDSVTVGETATFTLTATDAGAVDQASDFTFAVDWDGDGTVDETVVAPSGTQLVRTFSEEGDVDVVVTATDKDGATSDAAVLSIDVVRGGGGGGQAGTAEIVNGDLVVTGTDGDDKITLRPDRKNPGQVKVRINRVQVGSFAPTGVIRVDAGIGDDEVYVSKQLTIDAILDGGAGDDFLRGGGGNDLLRGGEGNDELRATIGNDTLDGGAGNDLLRAGEGDDLLDGGDGDDELRGYRGNDILIGGAGNDLLRAGEGNDQLFGGDGDDELRGHRGNDLLDGGAGDDLIRGGKDGDIIDGGEGNDRLYGGSGDDLIRGGDGDDEIHGGGGDDILLGGRGNDRIDGSGGRDLIIGGWGEDVLRGQGDEDILVGGHTDYDANDEALRLLLAEWTRPIDYSERVHNVTTGAGSLTGRGIRLDATTVHDDDACDLLEGGGDTDLFFYNCEGSGVKDRAKDFKGSGRKSEMKIDTD